MTVPTAIRFVISSSPRPRKGTRHPPGAERACERSRPRSGLDGERGRGSLPHSEAVPRQLIVTTKTPASAPTGERELKLRSVWTHGYATRAFFCCTLPESAPFSRALGERLRRPVQPFSFSE